MNEERWLRASDRWLGLLMWFYPAHFREEMGEPLVEAYRDRFRAAIRRGGALALMMVWVRAFGDSLRNGLGERARPAIRWRRMGNWGRDPELAMRRLARAPLFVAAMIGTLGVGLGAFGVVYAAVHKVLLEPLPYERPDDLHYVWRNYTWFDLDRGWIAGTDIAALNEAGGPIEAVVGLQRNFSTLTSSGSAAAEPEEVAVMVSSAGLFDLLGARPVLGRTFAPGEEGPDREPLMVLGHDIWRGRFGADPQVVGSEVRLNDQPYTVIGVMGPDFRFVRHSSLGRPQGADVYTTVTVNLAETDPGSGAFAGLLRARPGSSPEAVAAAVAAVGARVDERDFNGRGVELYRVGAMDDLVAPVRPALLVLSLAGIFLVLVLAVNLATLLLVRATQREREFAIQRALGADRGAIVRATLLEGTVLGFLGGVAGVLVAVWGTRALVALAPADLPRRDAIAVDGGVALVVIGVGALLGLLAAAVPAIYATGSSLSALLKNAAVRGGGGHGRLRRGLVVVQVALSLVLLTAGGLVVRSFAGLLQAQPGFDAAGVLTFRVPVPQSVYPEDGAVLAVHERVHAELAAIPGVHAVGAVSALPMSASMSQAPVQFPGAPGNSGDDSLDRPLIDWAVVRPGAFEALGMRLLAGRAFEPAPPQGVQEVVIDDLLASTFFGAGDPIGATALIVGEEWTVVGVVRHARQYDLHQDGRPQVYVRHEDVTFGALSYTIRTNRSPMSLVSEARTAVWRVDPGLAVSEVRTLEDLVGESLSQQRLSATLIGAFSLGALLLATMGLFGVVAGTVDRRRHELAVRLALGADHPQVIRLVLREGMLLVLLGVLVGVPGIYLSGRALAGVLVGVSPFDPPTLLAVAVGLTLVAAVACYLPARRVAGIEPARLLRQE
jgi:predicted permease